MLFHVHLQFNMGSLKMTIPSSYNSSSAQPQFGMRAFKKKAKSSAPPSSSTAASAANNDENDIIKPLARRRSSLRAATTNVWGKTPWGKNEAEESSSAVP